MLQQQCPRGVRPAATRRGAVKVQAVLTSISQKETNKNIERLKKLRLITAVKTPYLANGKFDLKAYDAHLETQIKAGVEGVIVGGTTGEGQLMSWDEHVSWQGASHLLPGSLVPALGQKQVPFQRQHINKIIWHLAGHAHRAHRQQLWRRAGRGRQHRQQQHRGGAARH